MISALENKQQDSIGLSLLGTVHTERKRTRKRKKFKRTIGRDQTKNFKHQRKFSLSHSLSLYVNGSLKLHHGTNWIIRTLWINQHVKTSHTAYVFKLWWWWWWWWWCGFCRNVNCHLMFDIQRKTFCYRKGALPLRKMITTTATMPNVNWSEGKYYEQWNIKGCSHGTIANVIITARKRSLGQDNIFGSVCQEFCPQGGTYLGRYPPDQVSPLGPGTAPRANYIPRHQVHPPDRYTPQDQVHPPGTRYTTRSPPRAGTPSGTRYPPRDILGDTGHKRAVRILLECILVMIITTFNGMTVLIKQLLSFSIDVFLSRFFFKLRQSNVFTRVCDSVHEGRGSLSQDAPQVTWPEVCPGGLCPSIHHGSHNQGVSVHRVSVQGWGLCPPGLCPGLGSLSRVGVSVQGGLCPGGISVQGWDLCLVMSGWYTGGLYPDVGVSV